MTTAADGQIIHMLNNNSIPCPSKKATIPNPILSGNPGNCLPGASSPNSCFIRMSNSLSKVSFAPKNIAKITRMAVIMLLETTTVCTTKAE